MWIQRREEARRAEDSARQTGDSPRESEIVVKNDIGKFLASRDEGEMRAKEAAEKWWHFNQSSRKKRRESEERPAVHLTSNSELRLGEGTG